MSDSSNNIKKNGYSIHAVESSEHKRRQGERVAKTLTCACGWVLVVALTVFFGAGVSAFLGCFGVCDSPRLRVCALMAFVALCCVVLIALALHILSRIAEAVVDSKDRVEIKINDPDNMPSSLRSLMNRSFPILDNTSVLSGESTISDADEGTNLEKQSSGPGEVGDSENDVDARPDGASPESALA